MSSAGRAELGDEFQIVLATKDGMDELTLIVEAAPLVSEPEYDAVATKVADDFRARLELRPAVTVVAPDTLPKTEFKANRVRDERAM
jgi:phenylacetate-CoA ligase